MGNPIWKPQERTKKKMKQTQVYRSNFPKMQSPLWHSETGHTVLAVFFLQCNSNFPGTQHTNWPAEVQGTDPHDKTILPQPLAMNLRLVFLWKMRRKLCTARKRQMRARIYFFFCCGYYWSTPT
jgi:hypothetical protein